MLDQWVYKLIRKKNTDIVLFMRLLEQNLSMSSLCLVKLIQFGILQLGSSLMYVFTKLLLIEVAAASCLHLYAFTSKQLRSSPLDAFCHQIAETI